MRITLSTLSLVCVFSIAASALAQPRARRRGPPQKAAAPTVSTPAPAAKGPGAVRGAKMCHTGSAILQQEQGRLDQTRANLAGVDSELAQLKRRMSELTKERNNVLRSVTTHTNRVKKVQKMYDKNCKKDESCEQYEGAAGRLEGRGTEVEKEVSAVRTDINSSRTQIDTLRRTIDPLRTDFGNLKCNNMVPGQTEQSTIDRCSTIFSEWNRLQISLNQENGRLAALKSRYEQLAVRLGNVETHAKKIESYLAKNCAKSPKVAAMRGYSAVRQRAEKMGKELDGLISDVSKLRGIQITVSPR